jgi:hypothetical protein
LRAVKRVDADECSPIAPDGPKIEKNWAIFDLAWTYNHAGARKNAGVVAGTISAANGKV